MEKISLIHYDEEEETIIVEMEDGDYYEFENFEEENWEELKLYLAEENVF